MATPESHLSDLTSHSITTIGKPWPHQNLTCQISPVTRSLLLGNLGHARISPVRSHQSLDHYYWETLATPESHLSDLTSHSITTIGKPWPRQNLTCQISPVTRSLLLGNLGHARISPVRSHQSLDHYYWETLATPESHLSDLTSHSITTIGKPWPRQNLTCQISPVTRSLLLGNLGHARISPVRSHQSLDHYYWETLATPESHLSDLTSHSITTIGKPWPRQNLTCQISPVTRSLLLGNLGHARISPVRSHQSLDHYYWETLATPESHLSDLTSHSITTIGKPWPRQNLTCQISPVTRSLLLGNLGHARISPVRSHQSLDHYYWETLATPESHLSDLTSHSIKFSLWEI